MSEVLLEVNNLKKYFGPVKAVDGVSFNIRKGETFGLVGESGCGKTTLGRTILKLMEPTEGKVYLRTSLNKYEDKTKHDITEARGRYLRNLRRKMQIVYQDPASSLNPRMLIRDIIGEPLKVHNIAKGEQRLDLIINLLKQVGLQEEHLWRYPYELSGGQRQRVAITRAIAVNPELLVLDEPTSALDVSVQAKVLKLLKKLQRELNLTYLFITHDMSVVDYMCDRVGVMYVGKLVENAPKQQLFNDPQHPYAKALLSAVPSLNPTKRKLSKAQFIRGEVASPSHPPSGCRFHPRCNIAFEECGFGSIDFLNYLNDNFSEIDKIQAKTRDDFNLEINLNKGDKPENIKSLLLELISDGTKDNQQIFKAIKKIKKGDHKLEISFLEKPEPDLIEGKKDHYVACYAINPPKLHIKTELKNNNDQKRRMID